MRVDSRFIASHKQSYYYELFSITHNNIVDWTYHNKCACNEYDALLRRHCQQTDVQEEVPIVNRYKENFLQFANINKMHDYKKFSYKQVMQHTRTSIRKRYQKAYKLLHTGYANIFSGIDKAKAFIKFEKAKYDGVMEDRKPARLIQHRSFEYLYLLKATILPISLHIKKNILEFNGQIIETMFSSGKNSFEVAQNLYTLWNEFDNPVAVCLDCSSWDGHINKLQREQADLFWKRVARSKLLNRLLKMQSRNTVTTQNMVKYIVDYVRLSGEFTTSDENSILNIVLIITVFTCKTRLCVMGDDSVVFLNLNDWMVIRDTVIGSYAAIGHTVKVDKVCHTFQEIEYCQSSPVRINGRWRMVRNPYRVIGRARYTDTDWPDLNRYIVSIGLCELACNSGVPILQQFALYLMDRGAYNKPVARIDREYVKLEDNIQVLPITAQSRDDFEMAFGITIAEQIRMEELFSVNNNKYRAYVDRYNKFHKSAGLG